MTVTAAARISIAVSVLSIVLLNFLPAVPASAAVFGALS